MTGAPGGGAVSASPTLDQIFRRTVARQPDRIAVIDPPDAARVAGHAPRTLTFAALDRAVNALAQHFVQAGLPAGSVIGVQLPNTSAMAVTLLAALRAGLIVAPLPQLWRQADLTDALNRIGARALISAGMIDGVDHGMLALNATVEVFSIRHVAGFGDHLPEGMAPLDGIFDAAPEPMSPRTIEDARLAAVVTFDMTAEGRRAVPRNHVQMIAGGLAIALEYGMPADGAILSAIMPTSFTALATGFVSWLLSGSTLVLHQPFDAEQMVRQIAEAEVATLVLPAPAAMRLQEAGALAERPSLRRVIGVWRNPEQVSVSAPWSDATDFVDVYAFGEAGHFAALRDGDGQPAALALGLHRAPRASAGATVVGETLTTPKGTLALRGPMVAVAAYAPPPQSPEQAFSARAVLDYVDTGYGVRVDRANGTFTLTSPPAGLVAVGGYRFRADELQHWAQTLGGGAMLTALPDRLGGHRLAGRAVDNPAARGALAELGLNPLVSEAFRERAAS